uniref:Uncharacterized protein n=1 Tax=Candidatus Kentrum sp. SD TaxID=2126332 RepID=A0A451BRY9_9GAMM|nr:MAG: hypothetical protein BECKSD772D_GA0070982_11992 [Candidatus Kentron sp. SD]
MREIAKTSGFAKKTYPPWIVNKMLELDEHPELEDVVPTKITDFLRIYIEVWVISSKEYQEQYWGKQGQWGDNFGETTMTFEEDAENILEENDPPIEMTPKQREMLSKLLRIVEEYDGDPSTPLSRYGENDKAIVNDPKWQEIGKYAKLVYEELSGDDLDAWEKSRALAKP